MPCSVSARARCSAPGGRPLLHAAAFLRARQPGRVTMLCTESRRDPADSNTHRHSNAHTYALTPPRVKFLYRKVCGQGRCSCNAAFLLSSDGQLLSVCISLHPPQTPCKHSSDTRIRNPQQPHTTHTTHTQIHIQHHDHPWGDLHVFQTADMHFIEAFALTMGVCARAAASAYCSPPALQLGASRCTLASSQCCTQFHKKLCMHVTPCYTHNTNYACTSHPQASTRCCWASA